MRFKRLEAILLSCFLAGCTSISEREIRTDIRAKEISREVSYSQNHCQNIEELLQQVQDTERKIELKKNVEKINKIIDETKNNTSYAIGDKPTNALQEEFTNLVNELETRKNPYLNELANELKDYSYIEIKKKEQSKISGYSITKEIVAKTIFFPILVGVSSIAILPSIFDEEMREEYLDIWKDYFTELSFAEEEKYEVYDIYAVYPYKKETKKVKENVRKEDVREYLKPSPEDLEKVLKDSRIIF